MVDVFVSYSSIDRERVRPIVAQIEGGGFSVWWDREIGAGSAFDREIEKAIDEASCVVVVWSENSVESEWVRTEANEGLTKGNLVPVAIEPVKPPLAFRRIQTIDLTQPDSISSLVSAISKLLPTAAITDGLPLVGRLRELDRLKELIESSRKSDGGVLLYSGEAGIGKTRMTLEADRLARSAGMLVLRGQCSESEASSPYQPTVEHIESLRRLISADAMRRSMGDNATEISKLMPELRQHYVDIPAYPIMPPEQERRYLLHGISEFFARGAQVQPLMLVFEDLHWADESTCIMLRYLTQRLKDEPVLILGTYRDQDLAPASPFGRALQELTRARRTEEVRLSRLDPGAISELLVRRFGATPPQHLIELVFSETEGNPFFIDEVLRHLVEQDKLLTPDGTFREGIKISDTEVTRGVRMMIEDRVSQVGIHTRETLSIAAVAGRTFAFDLLIKADSKHDEDTILDAIEEAERNRLIEDASDSRIARYRFVHEQIRQTLLSGLSFPRRQRLHLRIADALEDNHKGNLEKHAGEIGYHLYHAGPAADRARTSHHLTLAGERAIGALAFEDALGQFDLALSALGEEGEEELRARLQALRSKALYGSELIAQSLEALTLAISVSRLPETKDQYILQRCWMLLDIWRGKEALLDLEALLKRASEDQSPERELLVLPAVARAYYVMSLDHAGYAEKTKLAYERTIEIARTLGAKEVLASALIATAQLVDYWPEFRDQARKNLDEADAIAQELADLTLGCDVATQRLGMLDNSAAAGEEVMERLIALRDPLRLNALYFRMMWATLRAGRLERCVEICDAGVELTARMGVLPVQYPTIKAFALMDLGRFDEAWAALDQEIADEDHRFGAALQSLGRMHYDLAIGDTVSALQRAPHVIAESRVLVRAWMLRWVSEALATAAALHAKDEAILVQIESLVAATGYPPGLLAEASQALAKGDTSGGRAKLAKVIAKTGETISVAQRLSALLLDGAAALSEGDQMMAQDRLGAGVALARATGSQQSLWRLLSLSAQTEERFGQADTAERIRAEALGLMTTISASIPDPLQRQTMTSGAMSHFSGVRQ